ncbi:MAG TPA: hypothetical protein VH877_32435 [Polyangia bacterium]|jgi:hypothetical protein|nr:hypothetical protein [Polyangia bacterium]
MLLFPVTMGLSTVLSLAGAPSPYSIVAVSEGLTRTRLLYPAWLAVAVGWILVGLSRAWASSLPSSVALGVSVTATLLALSVLGAQVWLQTALAAELGDASARVVQGNPVTVVDAGGTLVARRRGPEPAWSLPSARRGVTIFLLATVAAAALFVGMMLALGAAGSAARSLQCLLLTGSWMSLGVIGVDLVEDVWPGFTSEAGLARASRYYSQIFEQWRNPVVLAAFLVVILGAPLAWTLGLVPASVTLFPVWIAGCICFTTLWNQVLLKNGVVASRLPLPAWVNEYSAARPLWAHFFAVIHTVMAICLIAGLGGLHRTLA